MLNHREQLIALNLIPGIGSLQLQRLLTAFGDTDRLWKATVHELQQVEGITSERAQRIATGCRDERRLADELELAARAGVELVTLDDDGYPQPLRTISDPPLALYVQGTLESFDRVAVGIVGTRRASLYGTQSAGRLGYDLALRGVTVVSGLARGIDTAAHHGALKASGRTLAVLGNGLSMIYPPEHEALAQEISECGALISEYPMRTQPLPHHFPRRNRIISGLSLGVVVVEAATRSGALITADCALEQGREVFAIPGPMTAVTSQGTHQLLKQGARLVTSIEDILEELRLTPQLIQKKPKTSVEGETAAEAIPLPESERRVLACLREDDPRYIDVIAAQSALELPAVSTVLLHLELKRLIHQLPGKQFVRVG